MKNKINSIGINIERIWSMPNKNTFEIIPIKNLITEEVDLSKKWIDPFANKNKYANITNDLNKEYDTDYHLDALDFLKLFENESVDGVLYDPPYSPRQVSECYNDVGYNVTWDTTKASFWGNHKREISRIVKVGGKVITFGWNSGGIGVKYGFEIQRILLVPHGGWHNDTICTVEVKTHNAEISKEEKILEKSVADRNEKMSVDDKKLIKQLEQLPKNFWDFKNEETRTYTHGIHNYPAMMVSPISRNIIKIMQEIKPINSLLDPFSGSGTVLVEGMLAGINKISGNDINPLALMLSKAKTTPVDTKKLHSIYDNLNKRLIELKLKYDFVLESIDSYMMDILQLNIASSKGWGDNALAYVQEFLSKNKVEIEVPNFKNIGYWFKPKVLLCLSIIKSEIKKIEDEAIKNYIFVAFSETVRLVSNRRNGEFKMFRMPEKKVLSFNPDVFLEFQKILNKNIIKMDEFTQALVEEKNKSVVSVYSDNSCSLEHIEDNAYDLIITSPPYGDSRTTVAYGEFSRLSLQWIDLFALSEKQIMGVDKSLMGGKKYRNGFEFKLSSDSLKTALQNIMERDVERAGDVYSFYQDLDLAIASIARKTKVGGYNFWVVGNRTVKNELLRTDIIISELAYSHGMKSVYTIKRNIGNKVMPCRNSPSNVVGDTNKTMTTENIVILRKL